MKVESKNKYVEIPFYLEQAIRKIIIYKARNNTARKPGDNRSGKNCIKMASCYFLATIQKKALFHISKTELFSYRLSVQACQLRIGWLSPVKVNQASGLNNLNEGKTTCMSLKCLSFVQTSQSCFIAR